MTLVLMNCYSTAAKVDMKYDFTFDGKQGRCIYVSVHNYKPLRFVHTAKATAR